MEKFKFLGKNKISKLPKTSGVYVFKKGKKFLYIGKASNIKERVKNHFRQFAYRDNLFLNQVGKIGYLKTDSEIEALILEANLIKQYQPKYNVIWRDDKNYFFVAVTKEDFPRVFWTHQTKLKTINYKLKTDYIGPFVDGKSLKQTLKILRKVFPYRSCRILPKKPCLWYQINRCLAPCLLKANLAFQISEFREKMKNESQENTKNLVKILQRKKKIVLGDLKKTMKKASISEDFERAAQIRDQIKSLERIISHARIFEEIKSIPEKWQKTQKVFQHLLKTKRRISRIEAYDVSNIQGKLATGSMITFINGKADKNFYRRFKIKIEGKPNDIAMIGEVLSRRFGHPEWPFPDLILIDGGKAQLNVVILKAKSYKLKAEIMALAKKKNELFIENQKVPILLKNLPREIFNLILQLRDEAHRFAISYHRKLRKRQLIGRE